MSVILILTNTKDVATELVVKHLAKRGVDFVRFNTEEFPQKIHLTIRFEDLRWKGELCFPDRHVNLDEISVVWNRRPHRPIIDPAVSNPTVREWGEEEAWHALYTLWSVLRDRVFWLNPVEEGLYVGSNKWLQLVEAQKVGLPVPHPSLMSNDPAAIKQFCFELKTLAMKTIRVALLKYPQEGTGLLHTLRIRSDDLNDQDFQRMRFVPMFLQRYIEKKLELRITVVGDRAFPCAIYSQEQEETRHDWRSQIFTSPIRHESFDLPKEIADKCVALTHSLGLHFGAIDMALTPDDEYVFFEINQNGEWAWVEIQTGLQISKAIADILIAHS